MQKLISFVLNSEFGFFKKPDINEGIYLTFNSLHKPALLGILGAISGLSGFKAQEKKESKWPEYYQKLKHIPMAIEPLNSDKGAALKTAIQYNNTTGFASKEKGGNLIVNEQTLLNPSFRCYLLLDTSNELEATLYSRILEQEAEYLPYFGKNEYSVWWDAGTVIEYEDFQAFDYSEDYQICNAFIKEEAVSKKLLEDPFSFFKPAASFVTFDKLPVSYNETLRQYEMKDFVYSNATFQKDMIFQQFKQLIRLYPEQNKVVQLY